MEYKSKFPEELKIGDVIAIIGQVHNGWKAKINGKYDVIFTNEQSSQQVAPRTNVPLPEGWVLIEVDEVWEKMWMSTKKTPFKVGFFRDELEKVERARKNENVFYEDVMDIEEVEVMYNDRMGDRPELDNPIRFRISTPSRNIEIIAPPKDKMNERTRGYFKSFHNIQPDNTLDSFDNAPYYDGNHLHSSQDSVNDRYPQSSSVYTQRPPLTYSSTINSQNSLNTKGSNGWVRTTAANLPPVNSNTPTPNNPNNVNNGMVNNNTSSNSNKANSAANVTKPTNNPSSNTQNNAVQPNNSDQAPSKPTGSILNINLVETNKNPPPSKAASSFNLGPNKFGNIINKITNKTSGGSNNNIGAKSANLDRLSVRQIPGQSPQMKLICRVFWRDGTYRTVPITPTVTAKELVDSVTKKTKIALFENLFDLYEVHPDGTERILNRKENVYELVNRWDPNLNMQLICDLNLDTKETVKSHLNKTHDDSYFDKPTNPKKPTDGMGFDGLDDDFESYDDLDGAEGGGYGEDSVEMMIQEMLKLKQQLKEEEKMMEELEMEEMQVDMLISKLAHL